MNKGESLLFKVVILPAQTLSRLCMDTSQLEERENLQSYLRSSKPGE
jgi:hypothetical protein